MSKINKFFFFLGLFAVNAFRYNWKIISFSALMVGIPETILFKNAWQVIPCFMGSYLAAMYCEYRDHKNEANANRKTN